MASQDHIRNPVEWGWGQLSLAALTAGSLGRSLRGSEESQYAPLPAVSRIKTADLKDVLIKGLDDFAAYRTDVIFLCLIYPLAGIALVWLTFGYDMLPLHISARVRLRPYRPGRGCWPLRNEPTA